MPEGQLKLASRNCRAWRFRDVQGRRRNRRFRAIGVPPSTCSLETVLKQALSAAIRLSSKWSRGFGLGVAAVVRDMRLGKFGDGGGSKREQLPQARLVLSLVLSLIFLDGSVAWPLGCLRVQSQS